MRRALIVLPALFAFPLAGCVVGFADGQAYSDSLRSSYTNFRNVDVSAGVRTTISQGPFDVKAEAPKGDSFDNLIVEVNGDTLRISRKPHLFDMDGPQYHVTVSAPDYKTLDVSSGASLKGGNLALKDVSVGVSSGGSMTLDGACTTLDIDVSSGGSFDGEALKCNTATADASSGGSADVYATQVADGDASSGGSVNVYGKPAQFREDSSSGGSVRLR